MKNLFLLLTLLTSMTMFSQVGEIVKWTYVKEGETIEDKKYMTSDAWFEISEHRVDFTLDRDNIVSRYIVINNYESEDGYFVIDLREISTGQEAALIFLSGELFTLVFEDLSAIVGFYIIKKD